MKNVINTLTGKKAMYTVLTVAIIGTVMEIVTAIRIGSAYKIDFMAIAVIFTAITVWASSLNKKNAPEA